MYYLKIITIVLFLASLIGCQEDSINKNNQNYSKRGFQIDISNKKKYDEPLLWGYNCRIDYNPDFCPKSKEYYLNNYDIDFGE